MGGSRSGGKFGKSSKKKLIQQSSAELIHDYDVICLQSLQLTSFMMTVCNVIIVVIDWFIDANLLR